MVIESRQCRLFDYIYISHEIGNDVNHLWSVQIYQNPLQYISFT